MSWLQGWLLYDGECALCRHLAARFEKILTRRGFDLAPLQAPWVRECLDAGLPQALTEIRLFLRDGRELGGADAILFLSRRIWWAWPLALLGWIPGLRPVLRAGYGWIAARRHCAAGLCARPSLPAWAGAVPLLVLPLLAWAARPVLADWGFMWAMAFAIYAGCKWLTWWKARRELKRASSWRWAAYLLFWPGMDAASFLDETKVPARPRLSEWLLAILKFCFGLTLLWGIARMVLPANGLLAGWIGLAGLIFVLHFGMFHLLALFHQNAGVRAGRIMRNPIAATSLNEFWSARWNLAFHGLAADFLFRPLLPILGQPGATLATFLISGLVHELVISLPAGAGFGLPTAYFVLQGVGVLFERSGFARRLGLRTGMTGWLFTALLTAVPAFWLFHPPFIHRVMLPFMRALGAL